MRVIDGPLDGDRGPVAAATDIGDPIGGDTDSADEARGAGRAARAPADLVPRRLEWADLAPVVDIAGSSGRSPAS